MYCLRDEARQDQGNKCKMKIRDRSVSEIPPRATHSRVSVFGVSGSETGWRANRRGSCTTSHRRSETQTRQSLIKWKRLCGTEVGRHFFVTSLRPGDQSWSKGDRVGTRCGQVRQVRMIRGCLCVRVCGCGMKSSHSQWQRFIMSTSRDL